jgi:hypothetical protein
VLRQRNANAAEKEHRRQKNIASHESPRPIALLDAGGIRGESQHLKLCIVGMPGLIAFMAGLVLQNAAPACSTKSRQLFHHPL